MTPRRSKRRAIWTALFAAVVLGLSACATNAPQDTLTPEGPIARDQHALFVPVFWIAAAIFFLVEILFVVAIFKFRDRGQAGEPKQVHGNTRLELTWTIIPALILLGISVPTVATIFRLSGDPEPDAVKVHVVGHQWWWEYRYLDTEPQIQSANELVIPTGKQVFLTLESADVIHSFWVPKLAGKQDVVPGRTNDLRIEASEPGIYEGQCAEFCALSHARMRLRVRALAPADYDRWIADQQRNALEPAGGDAAEGKRLFLANSCIGCHTINGTAAQGKVGPDLTHLASRTTFGVPGMLFTDNIEDMVRWIEEPRTLKPGVIMPNFKGVLSDDEIRAIAAYLLSLK